MLLKTDINWLQRVILSISLDLLKTKESFLTENIWCSYSDCRNLVLILRKLRTTKYNDCNILLLCFTHPPKSKAFFSDISLTWFIQSPKRIYKCVNLPPKRYLRFFLSHLLNDNLLLSIHLVTESHYLNWVILWIDNT